MGSAENFCLRWNDFESNVSGSFRELRAESDFFDVTLGCDQSNGRVLQAHKVILSACSTFFKAMLKEQMSAGVTAHPYVYLRGVKYGDLESILDFMYHGEVNVAQSELNSFLAVAEDLQVKGLTQPTARDTAKRSQGKSSGTMAAKRARHSTRLGEARAETPIEGGQDQESEYNDDPKAESDTLANPSFDGETYTFDAAEASTAAQTTTAEVAVADSQANKATDFNELVFGLLSFENGIHTCNLCGKKSPWRTTMLRHVEANHVETAGHVCDICGNVSKTRHAFNMHKKRMHEKGPDGQPNNQSRRARRAKQAKTLPLPLPAPAVLPVQDNVGQQIQIVQHEQGGHHVVHQGQVIDGQVVIQTQNLDGEVITQQFH